MDSNLVDVLEWQKEKDAPPGGETGTSTLAVWFSERTDKKTTGYLFSMVTGRSQIENEREQRINKERKLESQPEQREREKRQRGRKREAGRKIASRKGDEWERWWLRGGTVERTPWNKIDVLLNCSRHSGSRGWWMVLCGRRWKQPLSFPYILPFTCLVGGNRLLSRRKSDQSLPSFS